MICAFTGFLSCPHGGNVWFDFLTSETSAMLPDSTVFPSHNLTFQIFGIRIFSQMNVKTTKDNT
jgi:hypothetical protein